MLNRLIILQRVLTICVITIIAMSHAIGQKVYVTESGQSIQLFPNGQWKYLDENTLDEQGLIAESKLDVDPYELPTSTFNITEEEEELYQNLKKQLQFLEADFFVRHLIIENKINNNEGDKTDKKLEKDLKEKYKTSYELLEKLSRFQKSERKDRDKIIDEVRKKLVKEFKVQDLNNTAKESEEMVSKEINLGTFPLDERSPYEILRKSECEIVYDGQDKQLGKSRKEIKSDKWFTYTHPKLFNHFKDNDFLTGEASLMKVGKKTYLNLRLILATRDARRSYGYVPQDAMLRISMINGDRIYLKNQVRSNGNLEAYTGNTLYQCIYPINGDDLKDLKRTEIDRVGIMWSTGFEEYDVYEVDFLMNQLYCLENDK